MELAGEGALLKMLEDRRRKLAAEGLFDDSVKQPIPYLPEVIGIVTSPTGAVIRDILHRLADRFPRPVLLAPVLVQGQGAAAQVAAAIAGFNALEAGGSVARPDVLIVARGGGSLEDLAAFNEEIVVRAVAGCTIPVISAIGHETDTTLIDFAADRRAPTPTAAAEMAVPVRSELVETVLDAARRMVGGMARLIEARRLRIEGLARGLPDAAGLLGMQMQRLDAVGERLGLAGGAVLTRRGQGVALLAARLKSPAQVIARAGERVDGEARALFSAMARLLERRLDRLGLAGGLLDSYSTGRVLERGYAIIRDDAGRPMTSATQARPGDSVTLQFADDTRGAVISGAKPRRKTAPSTAARQGELL
jgi:exodeoxyribonuclease VII large subunit